MNTNKRNFVILTNVRINALQIIYKGHYVAKQSQNGKDQQWKWLQSSEPERLTPVYRLSQCLSGLELTQ